MKPCIYHFEYIPWKYPSWQDYRRKIPVVEMPLISIHFFLVLNYSDVCRDVEKKNQHNDNCNVLSHLIHSVETHLSESASHNVKVYSTHVKVYSTQSQGHCAAFLRETGYIT